MGHLKSHVLEKSHLYHAAPLQPLIVTARHF